MEIKNNKTFEFMAYIRGELKRQDISIAELSRRIGVPRNTIHAWLNGQNSMNIEAYNKILDALEIKSTLISNKK